MTGTKLIAEAPVAKPKIADWKLRPVSYTHLTLPTILLM